jgi:hypothetical protein
MANTVTARAASATYPDRMNPRTRRLIVSGVLICLVVIVLVAALWGQFT